jgi:hypothetical protein
VRELAATWPLVERAIGRPLRPAEKVRDWIKIGGTLDQAKDDLAEAIRIEQRRAVRRAILRSGEVVLSLTAAMTAPLAFLKAFGAREARAELRRAGYDVSARALVARPIPGPEGPTEYVRAELAALSVKIERERVVLEASGAAQEAVIGALYKVAGARGIASKVVTTAMNQGFASTFADFRDVVSGWERTGAGDADMCDVCASEDGAQFDTWEEAMDSLPEGGPDPDCAGGGACRCELVPLGPG